jgi:hypothetical protein
MVLLAMLDCAYPCRQLFVSEDREAKVDNRKGQSRRHAGPRS